MNKILNLIMLALLVPFALTAQIWGDDMIIVGQVTEIGSPVANHMVSVSYSANMPGGISGTETTLTNVDGYYQFNITDGSISGPTIVFEVFTEDSCSGVLYEVINNGQGTVDIDTVNFELCGGVGCGVDISYVNDPTLGGNMLTANPTGIAPFTYQWDSGETSGTIFPPEPLNGTYCVTVVDANGCVATSCYTFNINTPCSASITAQQDPVDSTSYTFTASNLTGVAPFTYEWWPGQETTQSITVNMMSNWDLVCVTVEDANGCIAYACDTVYPSGCSADFMMWGNNPNGSISANDTVQAYYTGTVESGNIYEWTVSENGVLIATYSGQNPWMWFPAPGDYEVCVTVDNGNGCSDTYCNTVTVGSASSGCSATIYLNEDSIGGVLNAELWVVATGVAPFTYEWSNGATTESIYLQNIVGVDTICVTITDANGCTSTSCELIGFEPGNCEGWISGYVGVTAINAPIPLDQGTVWLITYDATTNLLTAVDSASIDSGGYFSFGPIPCGDYLVKAAAGPNSAYYSDHIPTYFGNSPFWDFAQTVSIDQLNTQVITAIELIAGANPGGPGFIGGDVTQGANKVGDIGDPVIGATVLLFDNSSNVITYAYTDANGEFGFDNLAWGTYQVYVEMLNKTTTPVIVTIGPSNPSVEGIHVLVFDLEINTSVEDVVVELTGAGLYPNPASDYVSVELSSDESVNLQVSVRDLTGRIIQNEVANLRAGANRFVMDVSALGQGYYSVEFINPTAGVKLNQKLIVAGH